MHRGAVLAAHLGPRPRARHEVEAGEPGREGAARTGQHLGGSALLDDPARVEHHDAVGEQQRVEHVVGHQEHRPVGEHRPQCLPHRRRHVDVQRGHRLVEEQEPGLGRQGARDRDALCLTARQPARSAVGQLADTDPVEPVLGLLAGLGPGDASAAGTEGDVVQRRQVREEQRVLSEQGRTTVVGRDVDRGARHRRPSAPGRRGRPGPGPAAPARRPRRAASTCPRRWGRGRPPSLRPRRTGPPRPLEPATAASSSRLTAWSCSGGRRRSPAPRPRRARGRAPPPRRGRSRAGDRSRAAASG